MLSHLCIYGRFDIINHTIIILFFFFSNVGGCNLNMIREVTTLSLHLVTDDSHRHNPSIENNGGLQVLVLNRGKVVKKKE
jgi:hypothetical protein